MSETPDVLIVETPEPVTPDRDEGELARLRDAPSTPLPVDPGDIIVVPTPSKTAVDAAFLGEHAPEWHRKVTSTTEVIDQILTKFHKLGMTNQDRVIFAWCDNRHCFVSRPCKLWLFYGLMSLAISIVLTGVTCPATTVGIALHHHTRAA